MFQIPSTTTHWKEKMRKRGRSELVPREVFNGNSSPTMTRKLCAGQTELPKFKNIAPADGHFVKEMHKELAQCGTPFLELIPTNSYLSKKTKRIKLKKFAACESKTPVQTIRGPLVDRGKLFEDPQMIGKQVCARSISTYPMRSDTVRDGDPICDKYAFTLFHNRSISVIADGCNWGERPKVAAERARDTILEYFLNTHSTVQMVEDLQWHLLCAFKAAHSRICLGETPKQTNGTTTLIAGVTMEIETKLDAPNEWAFVCASVGDCKVYIIEQDFEKIREISLNYSHSAGESDCGGRLGPAGGNGVPDLRNLRTFCCSCEPGDIILMMSDGAHDNLHPEHLNVQPRELLLDFDDWDEARTWAEIEEVAAKYRTGMLENLLMDTEYTPENIVERIMDHCIKITHNSRTWMENNNGKRTPLDYALYPGKMDHTTCIAFRVGRANIQLARSRSFLRPFLITKVEENNNAPIRVTMTISPEHLKLYCRTIPNGKLECTILNPRECILQVTPKNEFVPPDGFEVLTDELSIPITRIVKLPKNIRIDTTSFRKKYKENRALIVLQFRRVKLVRSHTCT